MHQRDSKLWFYLSFCDVFKVNLSDFGRNTINNFLRQLNSFKVFHDQLTKQVHDEFDLQLRDKTLQDFILRRLQRVASLESLNQENPPTDNEVSSPENK